jgi:replication initiation protein RepC
MANASLGKGRGGAIEQAYGFDLSPIVARAAEEFVTSRRPSRPRSKAFRLVKERLTTLPARRRQADRAGIDENVPGNWARVQRPMKRSSPTSAPAPRQLARRRSPAIWTASWEIRDQTLESFVKSQNSNANESHSERHIQNSNPDFNPTGETEYGLGNKDEASGTAEDTRQPAEPAKTRSALGDGAERLPDIVPYAEGGHIRTLAGFAWPRPTLARPSMGVSPSAWQEAVEVMGAQQRRDHVLAAILQRGEQIAAGGYLRSLTDRARRRNSRPGR